MRIKTYVKNPSIVRTDGEISIEFVSNYANYLYEIKNMKNLFATKSIILHSSKAVYFWGMSATYANERGCPVRIFISDGIAVWNKISLPFFPEFTLPDSSEGFKLYANVEGALVVNEISIYTDVNAFGSDPVKCRVTN